MSAPLMILGLLVVYCAASDVGQSSNHSRDRNGHSIKRSSHHHYESPTYQGFWKEKFIWKPHWVKTWQEKNVYVAVWKRMWGPAEVKEWLPVPKPPPGWIKHGSGRHFVKVGQPH